MISLAARRSAIEMRAISWRLAAAAAERRYDGW
jgi:hypothetical protein